MSGYEEKNASAAAVDTEEAAASGAGGADSGTEQTEAFESTAGDSVTESAGTGDQKDGAGSGAGAETTASERDTDHADADGGQSEPAGPGRTPQNARAAAVRRERQAELQTAVERAKTEARVEAILDVLGRVNPYTHTPMKDAEDVAIYERQRAIEAKGGDPVAGYAEAMAEERRAAAAEAERQAREAKWLSDDAAAFGEAHPEVALDELLRDEGFGAYAEGKVGSMPLSEIYDGYMALVGKYTAEAREKAEREAAQRLANAQAAVGSVNGRSQAPALTKEKFQKMPYSERAKLYREDPELWRRMATG